MYSFSQYEYLSAGVSYKHYRLSCHIPWLNSLPKNNLSQSICTQQNFVEFNLYFKENKISDFIPFDDSTRYLRPISLNY